MRTGSTFKLGVSSGYVAGICLFGAVIFAAFTEYNGTSIETVGFAIVILCAAIGMATLLFALSELVKWKPL